MRKVQLALILTIVVAVHLDWHLGRPTHIRHSLAWEQHWILGLVLGSCIACFLTWRGVAQPLVQFGRLAAAGFIGGQVIEPILEVLIYGVSLSFVYPAVRWVLFLEFAAAFLASGMTCIALHRLLRRRFSGIEAA